MTANQRKLLKQLQAHYLENPIINRNSNSYELKMNSADLVYLQAKGLVEIDWDLNLEAFVFLTDKGITYFSDQHQSHFETFIKSGLLPVIVSVIATLLTNYLSTK